MHLVALGTRSPVEDLGQVRNLFHLFFTKLTRLLGDCPISNLYYNQGAVFYLLWRADSLLRRDPGTQAIHVINPIRYKMAAVTVASIARSS